MKALGTGHIGVSPTDIEVLPDLAGIPQVKLKGAAQSKAFRMGIIELVISLSHSRDYAIASVIGTAG